MRVARPPTCSYVVSGCFNGASLEEFGIVFPVNPYRPKTRGPLANAWPPGRLSHVVNVRWSDSYRGWPIMYSVGLYTRQTPTIAVDGRWRDGGPVRDQPSRRLCIDLTTKRAGRYVDVDCYISVCCFDITE